MEFSQVKKFSKGLDSGGFTNEVTEALFHALQENPTLKAKIESACRLKATDTKVNATLLANLVLGTLRAQIPGLDWAKYQMPAGNPLQARLPQNNVDFENLAQQWAVNPAAPFVAPDKFEVHLSDEADMTFSFSVNLGFPLLGDGRDSDDLSCLLESGSAQYAPNKVSDSSVDELFAALGVDEVLTALGVSLCGGHGLMLSCARFDFEAPLYRYESTRQREQLRVQVLTRVHQLAEHSLRFGAEGPDGSGSSFGVAFDAVNGNEALS